MVDEGARGAAERSALATARWPLVGRAQELEVIAGAMDEGAGGIVLAGAPGVGKTRLARAVRDLARGRGWATEEVVATRAAAAIPLGAFAQVLPGDLDPSPGRLTDLLARAALALAAQAGGDRIVVTVDDAHLLDDASAALLHRLARVPEVFVVATVRAREAAPDAVVALWKDELVGRLDVEALPEDDTGGLVEAVLQGTADHTFVHRVWELTRGNALYVRELLLSGLESGSLRQDGGGWRWHGAMGAGERLQELVADRIGRLPPDHRVALELTAFGEPIGIHLLEAMAGIDVVDALERSELLLVHRDEKREVAWLAHPIYAEALRAGTPSRRAAAVQRQLADVVQGTGARRRDDALRIALWRLDGGGDVEPEALVAAAQQAEAAFDHALTERLARAALDVGGGVQAHMALGRALWQQGRAYDAERVWDQLADLVDDDEDRIAVALYRALNLFFQLGRCDEAEAVLEQLERRVPSAAARSAAQAERAIFHLYAGRPRDAEAAARAVLDAADSPPYDAVVASIALGPALAVAGRTDEATAAVDPYLPVAIGLPVANADQLAGQLLAGRFLALAMAGRLVEADDLASVTHQLALERHSHEGVAALSCALGHAALARGRPATAVRWLREAVLLLREQDRSGFLPWALAELTVASVLLGELDDADAAVAEADAGRRACLRLFEVELDIGRAWAAAGRGRADEAVALATSAADWAERSGQTAFAALALHTVARLGRPADVAARLERLATATDSALLQAAAAHARAAAEADAVALERAAEAFGGLGANLLAAEAVAEAAAVHRAAGRAGPATKAADRARALRRQCEGARTPALAALEDGVPLTRREREVAALAAEGLASREIAERLFVSVRTVDNHLHRAYYKLGVSSRAELAEVLSEPE